MLAGGGGRGTPGVGGVEVGYAIGVCLRLAEDGASLVLQDGVVEAHLGEQGRHPVGALGVGHPAPAPPDDAQRCPGELGDAPDEPLVAMHELEVVPPPATRPRYRARALESTPQVRRPVAGGAGSAGEGKLLRRLYSAVSLRADGVAGAAEAIRLRGREPGLQAELRAPQAHYGAGHRGALRPERDPLHVPATGGVEEAGELGAVVRAGASGGLRGELPPYLRGERGQPRTPPRRAARGRGAPQLRCRSLRPAAWSRAAGRQTSRPHRDPPPPAPPPPPRSGRRAPLGAPRSGRARR